MFICLDVQPSKQPGAADEAEASIAKEPEESKTGDEASPEGLGKKTDSGPNETQASVDGEVSSGKRDGAELPKVRTDESSHSP